MVVTSQVLRKVSLRLIPFLLLCYVVSFLDRVNVGFAGLQMNQDLGLTATQFGFGSAIFFAGYCLSEVPSNLMGDAAAAGIALVVALANVGGLIGPYLIGFLKDATGGYVVPLLVLSGAVSVAAVVALRLPEERPHEVAGAPAAQ